MDVELVLDFTHSCTLEIPGCWGEVMPIMLRTDCCQVYISSQRLFCELSAMMIVAPIFSAPGFNLRARVLLSVLVAALVAPSMTIPSSAI